jgi:hypothetical protein
MLGMYRNIEDASLHMQKSSGAPGPGESTGGRHSGGEEWILLSWCIADSRADAEREFATKKVRTLADVRSMEGTRAVEKEGKR